MTYPADSARVSIDRRNCHTCAYFYIPNRRVLMGLGSVELKRAAKGTADSALPGCFLALNNQEVQNWIKRNVGGTDDWPRKHPCAEHASGCPGWSINAEVSNKLIGLAIALHDAINATFPRGAVPRQIEAANKSLREALWPKTKDEGEDV